MLPSGHSPQERIMAHDRPAARSGTFVIGGDLPVHRLGFGAMRITGKGIWGPPEDPDEAIRVLRRCLELGIDFIDTADSYGPEVSERLIAEALHPYPPELVIATKAGLRRPGPDQWRPDGRPEYLRAQVLSSLQRLQLERIDLLQLHRLDPKVPLRDQIGALARLQHEGRIRHIGVSEVSVAELRMVRELVEVVTVQNLYNLADRKSEDVLDYCEAEGIGFIPWFPLATGAARGRALAGGAGLAAAPLAGDASDPGHLEGAAPGGERRRGAAGARRGDHPRALSAAGLTRRDPAEDRRASSLLQPADQSLREVLASDALIRSASTSCCPVMRSHASFTASFTFSHVDWPRPSYLPQPVRRSDSTSFQFRPIWCRPDS
jgi:aryl-alcohol dehydrogenase-like predicted oxidoreductase